MKERKLQNKKKSFVYVRPDNGELQNKKKPISSVRDDKSQRNLCLSALVILSTFLVEQQKKRKWAVLHVEWF